MLVKIHKDGAFTPPDGQTLKTADRLIYFCGLWRFCLGQQIPQSTTFIAAGSWYYTKLAAMLLSSKTIGQSQSPLIYRVKDASQCSFIK